MACAVLQNQSPSIQDKPAVTTTVANTDKEVSGSMKDSVSESDLLDLHLETESAESGEQDTELDKLDQKVEKTMGALSKLLGGDAWTMTDEEESKIISKSSAPKRYMIQCAITVVKAAVLAQTEYEKAHGYKS